MTVRKTPQAEQDLITIHHFIAEQNLSRINAGRYMQLMDDKFELLATQPLIGRERDDIEPGLRSHPIDRYIVYYRPVDGGIEIDRVIHAARDVEAIFH